MKNELPYFMTSEGIIGYSDSIIAKGEINDCVVRAFASCFDLQYDKAHKFVKEKFNRVDRKGTFHTVNSMMGLVVNKIQVNYKKVKRLGEKKDGLNNYSLRYKVKTKEGFVAVSFSDITSGASGIPKNVGSPIPVVLGAGVN